MMTTMIAGALRAGPIVIIGVLALMLTNVARSQSPAMPTVQQQRLVAEQMRRIASVRDCSVKQSHTGSAEQSTEKLPPGWERVTADGERVKIMAEDGNDFYLELRCIARSNDVADVAYVAIEGPGGAFGLSTHVLRFFCGSTGHSDGRVFFDDVTPRDSVSPRDSLERGGRYVSPNTVIGSIGFFACRRPQ